MITAAVLLGFFLMLFAPCLFAIYGGREKRIRAIAPSYADRAITQAPTHRDEELDLPMRTRPHTPAHALPDAPPADAVAEPMQALAGRRRKRKPELESRAEQAENEALAAHARAAQANALALAATARAAQARAEAAAEHALAASRTAANHVAAVREAQRYAEATQAALAAQPVSGDSGSRRAA